jgi:hypothetical protein
MEIKAKDEALLRKYLLGEASGQEQKEIELWLMSEEEAYDLLEAAEDDLIDDYLAGRLEGRALDRFNHHFLAAPERRRKLQFSRSFKRAIGAATPPVHVQPPTPDSSFRIRLLDALRYRPAVAYLAFALIIVMLMGNTWSLVQVWQLQQELRSANEQLTQARPGRETLQRQLDESQAATRSLEKQVRTLEASPAAANIPSAPALLALALMPGAVRSSGTVAGNPPQVRLTPSSSLVEFSLALLNDNFTVYRVSLVNGDRREILSHNGLAASATAQGTAIVVAVPARILSDRDYSLILYGIPDTGNPETVDRYDFRVVRQ